MARTQAADPGGEDDPYLEPDPPEDSDELEPEEPDEGEGGEPEPEPGEEPEPEPQQQRRGRAQSTIRSLRSTVQETRRQNEELQRRLLALEGRAQQPAPPDPRVARMEFEERLRAAGPDERERMLLDEMDRREANLAARARFHIEETTDQRDWRALCRSDPDARRLADRVEQRLREARMAGMNVSREEIFNNLIGAEYRAQAEQRRAGAARRVRAQQTRTPGTGARSGAPPEPAGRRGGDDIEAVKRRLFGGRTYRGQF